MKSQKPVQEPRRRRDFEESRELILEAADEAFADEGLGVSMKELATRAEVATATLYRHFANKSVLVRAVYESRILRYAEAIEAAQAQADPAQAFRQTIHGIVALQTRDRFFREFVREHEDPFGDELLHRFATPLIEAIEGAKEQGVLRAEVTIVDVFVLLTTVESVARAISSVAGDGLTRQVDLMLDGICSDQCAATAEPITYEQLFEVIKR